MLYSSLQAKLTERLLFVAIFQKMDTTMGLSSIATLSLGLSMSMAGAGRAVIRSLGPGHRQALEQFFPVVPPPTAALARLAEAGNESAESKMKTDNSVLRQYATLSTIPIPGGTPPQEDNSVLLWVGHLMKMSNIL